MADSSIQMCVPPSITFTIQQAEVHTAVCRADRSTELRVAVIALVSTGKTVEEFKTEAQDLLIVGAVCFGC